MKTITNLLKNNLTTAQLIKEVQFLKKIKNIFCKIIDLDLIKNISIVSYKSSILLVAIPNGSLATKLRFIIPDIIKELKTQQEFKDIVNIHLLILPKIIIFNETKKSVQEISHKNRTLWKKTINDLKIF